MTKEEMKTYADKYRKTQTKLSIGLSIFIFIIAAILLASAITLLIYADGSAFIYAAAVVMLILCVFDSLIGVRFIKYSKVKFKKIGDKEAAEHYCKIHGFDSKISEK